MKTRLIILAGLVFTIATIALSIFVIKPPKPIIEIKSEPLIMISDQGNEIMNVVITNTMFTAWVVAALLILVSFIATRKIAMVPSGFYNFFESIIEAIYNFVTGIAGEKNGRRFFPLIATFFLYIAFANWLSLTPVFNTIGIYEPIHHEAPHEHAQVFKGDGISYLPLGAKEIEIHVDECESGHAGDECREHAIEEATHDLKEGEKAGLLIPYLRGINTDLMTPLSFALISAFAVEFWGISTLGFFTYMSKFISFKSPIAFFVGFLELFSEINRLISFSFRLFGNMLAGEILLLVMTFLVAVASPIIVVFYGLELFVGGVQAFVFGTLTLVFAMMAVSAHGDEHDEHGQGGHEEAATHH